MSQSILSHLIEVGHEFSNLQELGELFEIMSRKKIVMLGEASHGSQDFYRQRAEISKKLIQNSQFRYIAVEGDWPDCYRINRYVKGYEDSGKSAREVLVGFERWPTWMWANETMVELVEWLKEFNQDKAEEEKVGFYGLDVYSLWDSLKQVTDYLEEHDPDYLPTARKAFACFEPYGEDPQEYARALALVSKSCRNEVLELLEAVVKVSEVVEKDREAKFSAEQNAVVAANAEAYYRAWLEGGAASWNVRDRHMHLTLRRLCDYFGPDSRGIVWAHNTHVGDSRYTDMEAQGEVNIGQLAREQWGEDVFLSGFATFEGTVIASRDWDGPITRMVLPEAIEGSWDKLFAKVGLEQGWWVFTEEMRRKFQAWKGQRAVGVVYHPEYERGNYVPTQLFSRYDGLLFTRKTSALLPLKASFDDGEIPETYPFGM